MEEIGVTAIVNGLSSFLGAMGQIQDSISNIGPPTSLLQQAVGALGGAFGDFASWVGDTLTYTLGSLLEDAIQGVVSMMGELIQSTIEAGNQFQTLTIRLQGLNLNQLIKSGMDYNQAQTESIKLTQDQLYWLQKLAITSPFDNTDISTAYSLNRAYGFTDEAARQLLKDTIDYVSGAGLQSSAIRSVTENMGQMIQRGKITATEMRDLARGAYLPLNDVLERVAKNMGITVAALTKAISKPGGGVPAEEFVKAFEQMVESEPRYVGAANRLGQAFEPAVENLKDLVQSVGGLNVIKPILDAIGNTVFAFTSQFVNMTDSGPQFTAYGQTLIDSAKRIGQSLGEFVRYALAIGPSSEELASGFSNAIKSVADWLEKNRNNILDWITDVENKFGEFRDNALELWNKIYDQLFKVNEATKTSGFTDLLDAAKDLAGVIGETLSPFFEALGLSISGTSISVQDVVGWLRSFAQWIRENEGLIRVLLGLFVAFLVIQTIVSLVIGLVGALITLVGTIVSTAVAFTIIVAAVGVVIGIWNLLSTTIRVYQAIFGAMVANVQSGIQLLINWFNAAGKSVTRTFDDINTAIRTRNWGGIGLAIVQGISRGISLGAGLIIDAARAAAWNAYQAALAILGIHSPSTLFAGIGKNVMMGMAQGITDSTSIAVDAMQKAVASVTMPALSAPAMTQQYVQAAPSSISNTYQNSNQFNLSIHSSAKTEPIVQDFGMLKSLSGL